MRKLSTRETRTIVAVLKWYVYSKSATSRGDDAGIDDFISLSDAQLDRLRERIAKAKAVNLS